MSRRFRSSPVLALVRRELLVGMRSGRVYLLLCLAVGGMMTATLLTWPDGTTDLADLGFYSRFILSLLVTLETVSMFVLVTALAGGSIPAEREKDTFDLLRTTLLSHRDIVLAKTVGAVALFFLIAITCLPVVSAVFFLVGIDWRQFGWSISALLLGSFLVALLAIAASARIKSTVRALGESYAAVIILFCLLPLVPFVVFVYSAAFPLPDTCDWLLTRVLPFHWISPILAASIMQSGSPAATFLHAMAVQTCEAIVFFWLALRGLRLGVRPVAQPLSDRRKRQRRRFGFPSRVISAGRPRKPIKDGWNPEAVKEFRWGAAGRGRSLTRLFCASFVIFAAYAYVDHIERDRESPAQLLGLQIAVFVALAPALVAGSLTRERELGNLDMLRLTLLTPREVILGKLLAGAAWLIPIVAASLLTWAILCLPWTGLRFWPLILGNYVTLFVCAWLVLALSLVASALVRTTSAAIATAYAFSLAALFGMQCLGVFGSKATHHGLWLLTSTAVIALIAGAVTWQAVALLAWRYRSDA